MNYFSFILFIALLASCGSNTEKQEFPQYSDAEMEGDFSKCPNGSIPAIFDEDTSKLLTSQEFIIAKGSVIETVTFATGVELTLEQSGCKVLKQRYSFRFPETPKEDNPNFWKALAIAQFDEMSTINEGFGILTGLIEGNAEDMQLGQPVQGDDYSLTIDKFEEGNGAVLVVSFDLIYPE